MSRSTWICRSRAWFALRRVRRSDAREGLEIRSLNDQHAYGRVGAGLELEVGDLVGLGICHPCTSFDKWRVMPVLDEDDRVVDAIATFF